jgi:hypothetical protein
LTRKFSLGILRFVPAGTIDYRQAWIYLFIFAVSVTLITLYLWKNDRELLKLYSSVIKSVIACYLRSGECPSLLRQKRHKGCITSSKRQLFIFR